jgi:hypothetical protein
VPPLLGVPPLLAVVPPLFTPPLLAVVPPLPGVPPLLAVVPPLFAPPLLAVVPPLRAPPVFAPPELAGAEVVPPLRLPPCPPEFPFDTFVHAANASAAERKSARGQWVRRKVMVMSHPHYFSGKHSRRSQGFALVWQQFRPRMDAHDTRKEGKIARPHTDLQEFGSGGDFSVARDMLTDAASYLGASMPRCTAKLLLADGSRHRLIR